MSVDFVSREFEDWWMAYPLGEFSPDWPKAVHDAWHAAYNLQKEYCGGLEDRLFEAQETINELRGFK